MDKRILKRIAASMAVLALIACVSVACRPSSDVDITHQENIQVQEKPPVSAEDTDSSGQTNAEKEKLHIELPEGLDGSGVKIENNYLTQTKKSLTVIIIAITHINR